MCWARYSFSCTFQTSTSTFQRAHTIQSAHTTSSRTGPSSTSSTTTPNNRSTEWQYGPQTITCASTPATTQMQAQQRRFLDIIRISPKRALHVHNIEPMEDFLNEQCINIVQRILEDPHRPITTSIQRDKYNNHIIVTRINSSKTRCCRRASESFAMGSSTNTRNQDESKLPRRHTTLKSQQSHENKNSIYLFSQVNKNFRFIFVVGKHEQCFPREKLLQN